MAYAGPRCAAARSYEWLFHYVSQNVSDLPIYEFQISVHNLVNDREATPKDVSLVAPGTQGMRIRLGDDGLQNSLANARRRARVDGGAACGGIVVDFRDTTGTRWRRELDGNLTELA